MVQKKREEMARKALKRIRKYVEKGDSETIAKNKTAIDLGVSYPTINRWLKLIEEDAV